MTARLRPLVPLAAQAVVVFAILFGLLDGWRRDFHVPFQFSRDALEYLMQVKGTIDHGWWWSNASLSAPGVFDQVAYPSNTDVDQAVVWIVHLFTSDAGLCLNLSWMIMVALTAPIATACLVRLGLQRRVAYVAGVLYALSPYALYRHIEHFALVIYLVPIPCTVALLLATGRIGRWRSAPTGLLLAGCVLLGFNYAYYAFFGAFVIAAGALLGFAAGWRRRALGQGLVFVAVVSAATLLNLAPSLSSWAAHGKPIVIPDKTAAESEVYGLKLRQLVSPTFDHALAPLRRWTELEQRARFPLETENVRSRLGLLETIGFLLLLAGLFAGTIAARLPDAALFSAASRLTLAAVLLGTVGGFGSLFSLLVSTEIRAYNRLCAFLAFFAWVGLGLALQRLLLTRSGAPASWRRAAMALTVVLAVGLVDQGHATSTLNQSYSSIREELDGLRWFVTSLEPRLPAGARVFQLPVTTYLNDTGRVRMLPYDHIKPYLVSRALHWSYPSLANPIVRWQHAVGRLPAPELTAALDAQGFAAIAIDRYGYDDDGRALLVALGATGNPAAILAESGRYVAVDLGRLPKPAVDRAWLPRLDRDFEPASAGLPACPGAAATQAIDQIGDNRAPWSDEPVIVSGSGDITIRGWAIDDRSRRPAGDVDLVIDGQAFATFYGVDRADVAARFTDAGLRAAGFLAKVPAARLSSGPHVLSTRVVAADRRCAYQGPDTRVIVR